MKNRLLLAIFASLFLLGCAEPYDPNLAQNPPKSEMDAARARRDVRPVDLWGIIGSDKKWKQTAHALKLMLAD